jgi:protein TonB
MPAGNATLLWQDPFAPRESATRRAFRFGLIAGLHVAALAGLVALAGSPELRDSARELVVRIIEAPRPLPEIKPPKPQPVKPEIPRRQSPPPPVMTAAAEAPAAPAFAVAPQPPAPAVLPPVQTVSGPAITAARFDADYLHNPKPIYPAFSRRMNEEGKVQLRVRVGADGLPLDIEIKQSSGFPRLDNAARDAVAKWRFVPAKRGDEAVESWVGVPIVFKLDT